VWKGPALVDGKPWPVVSDSAIWLPPGRHTIEPAASHPPLRVLDFNGELRGATVRADGAVELRYQSASRAIAILERKPAWVEVDGPVQLLDAGALLLPAGEHTVTMR
jgi:hypothetical protein